MALSVKDAALRAGLGDVLAFQAYTQPLTAGKLREFLKLVPDSTIITIGNHIPTGAVLTALPVLGKPTQFPQDAASALGPHQGPGLQHPLIPKALHVWQYRGLLIPLPNKVTSMFNEADKKRLIEKLTDIIKANPDPIVAIDGRMLSDHARNRGGSYSRFMEDLNDLLSATLVCKKFGTVYTVCEYEGHIWFLVRADAAKSTVDGFDPSTLKF